MPKITHIGRAEAKSIADAAPSFLKEYAASLGLRVRRGNASFSGGTLKVQVVFEVDDADAERSLEAASFAHVCRVFGLKPEHYGYHLDTPVGFLKLTGFRNSAKTPVEARRVHDDKLYFIPRSWLSKVEGYVDPLKELQDRTLDAKRRAAMTGETDVTKVQS